jgi:molybdopterin molybdotransferase
MALMSVDEALTHLTAAGLSYRQSKPVRTESLPLLDALGRRVAHDIMAPIPVPPERNSAMDGYAFAWADALAAESLVVSQRIPAGLAPMPLLPGTAARIFTGAVIPEGADTVEMQENCDESQGRVQFLTATRRGANIREAGEDIARDSLLLAAGTRLGAAELGLLASVGMANVNVLMPLTLAIVCTGNELVAPGDSLAAGQRYNSNETMLAALLNQYGCSLIPLPVVEDTLAATEQALLQALTRGADLVMTTGGVSVGEEDHLRAAVERLGRLNLWKVAIKPGKPLAFGDIQGVPILGLPGNPQSVWVTYHILALPFIRALQGDPAVPLSMCLPAGFEQLKAQGRREYLRVRVVSDADGNQRVVPHPQQGSGALTSAAWSDGFAVVEANTTVMRGQSVAFIPVK